MNKPFFLLAPAIALVAMLIFSLTLFPSVQPTPKQLPIALVNEDAGIGNTNVGSTIIDTLMTAAGDESALKWIVVDSKKALEQGLHEKEYYAALYIPENFSIQQASLQTAAPTNPTLQIFINQGMNAAVANITTQALNGIVDQINSTMRTQLLERMKVENTTVTPDQAAALATPIMKVVTLANAPTENTGGGNMPINFFQPIWISSLATAALLFFAMKKSKGNRFTLRGMQLVMGIIAAALLGFGLPFLAHAMIGFDVPHYSETALFLTLTAAAFIFMILAVMSFIGVPAIPLFALLLFFGAPLLALAPEMMSDFYRDFVYSWLPMRFMIDGLKDIFFFDTGITWENTHVLVWITLVSVVYIITSAFISKQQPVESN